MQENYPASVIAKVNSYHQLTSVQEDELRKFLSVSGMREIFDEKLLTPEALFKKDEKASGNFTLLSINAAKRLLDIYAVVKNMLVFKDKKITLSQMISWLNCTDGFYPAILSPSAAKMLGEDPKCMSELEELSLSKPEEMKKWDLLRIKITELNEMSQSHINSRKTIARQVGLEIEALRSLIRGSLLLIAEHFDISGSLFQHINAHDEVIKGIAKDYFENYYKSKNKIIQGIKFDPKSSGDQVGIKIKITYKDSEGGSEYTVTYHVKSHQYGSSSRGSNKVSVDLKELFVYKVLEYIGYGPKTHFVINFLSSGGFYIATQDVAFTKHVSKVKYFNEFQKLRDEYRLRLKEIGGIDKETYKGITYIDMLSRILVLHDTATNPENFGQVSVEGNRTKWKIIDFRTDKSSGYLVEAILKGFMDGNGRFNYPEPMARILKHKQDEEKIVVAKEVIDELENGKAHKNTIGKKNAFIEAVKAAFIEIVQYAKKNAQALNLVADESLGDLWQIDDANLLASLTTLPLNRIGDFGRYIRAVLENFESLATGIKQKHQEYLHKNPNPHSIKP